MDFNGDLKIDLFGITSPSSTNSPFKVWQNVWNASQPNSQMFNMCVSMLRTDRRRNAELRDISGHRLAQILSSMALIAPCRTRTAMQLWTSMGTVSQVCDFLP